MKLTKDHSLEKVLSICYAIPMGDPLDPACIWGGVPSLQGPPGIGKSSRGKQSGKYFDLPVGIVELGGRQPEDASGVPFLTKDDKLVIACILNAVNELNAKGKGVLILDEINWARPNTQGAFLSMVQDRRVGDMVFSNMIRIVLASNPRRSAGGGHPLIPPMANRCFHFDMEDPSEEDENAYLMGQGRRNVSPIENIERVVQEAWHDVWPKMVGQMIGFKRKFPQYVLAEPSDGDPQHHKAWPSPRSREHALRAATTVRILETKKDEKTGKDIISPLEDVFIEAACGEKMAVDWAVYRHEANLPDPLDMLTKGWTPDTSRIDRTMAAYGACASFVIGRPKKEEREQYAAPLWESFMKLLELGMGDIALQVAVPTAKAGLNMNTPGPAGKMAQKVMAEFAKKKLDTYIKAVTQ
jgi:hypothetical protein